MNILTMNQNVFGSSFETTRRSNFTENAISSELIIPDSAVELSYEEMEYVDGTGRFVLTINSTLGGFVAGLSTGIVTGFLVGFISAKFIKIGSVGGLKGQLIAGAIGAISGWAISSVVNSIVYGNKGPSSYVLIDIWIPFFNINHNIDLGEKLGSVIGGFGGGMGGFASAAAATAHGFAYGLSF